MLLNPFQLHTPENLVEASALISTLTNVRVLAGGTFLINNLKASKKKGRRTPEHIISLKNLKELSGIRIDNSQVIIGSMTTLTSIIEDLGISKNLPVLKKACLDIGTTPIRNMATIGGNLTCRYTWTELPAVMIALKADLLFLKTDGKDEIITAEEFFGNEAEFEGLLKAVVIKIDSKLSASYRRATKVQGIDTPMLAVCVSVRHENKMLKEARVVINTAVTFPQRDKAMEDFINNKTADENLVNKALENKNVSVYQDGDEYKKHMYFVSLKNALNEAIGCKGQGD